jgi:hypothetical protein
MKVNWKKTIENNNNILQCIFALYEMHKLAGANPFVDHIIDNGIRYITNVIAKKNGIHISSEAAAIGCGHKHHIKTVKEFHDEFRRPQNFTKKDAEAWLKDAHLILLSEEEHIKIHQLNNHIEQKSE